MIEYRVIVPESGDFLIAYPTPGAPQVMTIAGRASSRAAAIEECMRRNEAQVVDRRVTIVRKMNMIVRDREN